MVAGIFTHYTMSLTKNSINNSDKQISGHIQDGALLDQTSVLRKTGRTSRKGSLQNSRNNSRNNSNERPSSPSKSESWLCDTCDKLFENESDKLLTCEYCSNHRCINCLGMTQTVYKSISGRPDLPWFCSNCIVKSLECLKQTKSIEDRCAEYMADFERKVNERMGRLELEVHDMKSSLSSMKTEIVDEVKTIVNNTNPPAKGIEQTVNQEKTDNIIKQATSEMQSRIDRKNNIVLFNVNEQDGNIKEEIATKEKEAIIDIASHIGINLEPNEILNFKRVGKKNQIRKVYGEDKIVPRLLVVTLTESTKSIIMKNVHKLRKTENEYYQKIGIKHDMSQDEREKEMALKKEAKKKQDEDASGNFLYLVRGHPWERHIVKIKKNIQNN